MQRWALSVLQLHLLPHLLTTGSYTCSVLTHLPAPQPPHPPFAHSTVLTPSVLESANEGAQRNVITVTVQELHRAVCQLWILIPPDLTAAVCVNSCTL